MAGEEFEDGTGDVRGVERPALRDMTVAEVWPDATVGPMTPRSGSAALDVLSEGSDGSAAPTVADDPLAAIADSDTAGPLPWLAGLGNDLDDPVVIELAAAGRASVRPMPAPSVPTLPELPPLPELPRWDDEDDAGMRLLQLEEVAVASPDGYELIAVSDDALPATDDERSGPTVPQVQQSELARRAASRQRAGHQLREQQAAAYRRAQQTKVALRAQAQLQERAQRPAIAGRTPVAVRQPGGSVQQRSRPRRTLRPGQVVFIVVIVVYIVLRIISNL